LIANRHASPSWTPPPVTTVVRGGSGENYGLLYNDAAVAYACALVWNISGDRAFADSAINILNAWSRTLTDITGTSDKYLAAGLYGYQLANAAELETDFFESKSVVAANAELARSGRWADELIHTPKTAHGSRSHADRRSYVTILASNWLSWRSTQT
jgi:hypothetical protein